MESPVKKAWRKQKEAKEALESMKTKHKQDLETLQNNLQHEGDAARDAAEKTMTEQHDLAERRLKTAHETAEAGWKLKKADEEKKMRNATLELRVNQAKAGVMEKKEAQAGELIALKKLAAYDQANEVGQKKMVSEMNAKHALRLKPLKKAELAAIHAKEDAQLRGNQAAALQLKNAMRAAALETLVVTADYIDKNDADKTLAREELPACKALAELMRQQEARLADMQGRHQAALNALSTKAVNGLSLELGAGNRVSGPPPTLAAAPATITLAEEAREQEEAFKEIEIEEKELTDKHEKAEQAMKDEQKQERDTLKAEQAKGTAADPEKAMHAKKEQEMAALHTKALATLKEEQKGELAALREKHSKALAATDVVDPAEEKRKQEEAFKVTQKAELGEEIDKHEKAEQAMKDEQKQERDTLKAEQAKGTAADPIEKAMHAKKEQEMAALHTKALDELEEDNALDLETALEYQANALKEWKHDFEREKLEEVHKATQTELACARAQDVRDLSESDDDQMLVVRDGDDRDLDPRDMLTADEINDLHMAYEVLDTDGNGIVTIREFVESMKKDSKYDQLEMDRICSKLDSNRDSRVSLDEFLMARAMSKHSVITESNVMMLEEHFTMMDLDGSGAITRHELTNLIAGLGIRVREKEINSIMKQADADKNGKIGKVEFIQITKAVLTLTNQKVELQMLRTKRKVAHKNLLQALANYKARTGKEMEPSDSLFYSQRAQIERKIKEQRKLIHHLEGDGDVVGLEVLYKMFTDRLNISEKTLDATIRFLITMHLAEPLKLKECLSASDRGCSVLPLHLVRPKAGSALDEPKRMKLWVAAMMKRSQIHKKHLCNTTAATKTRQRKGLDQTQTLEQRVKSQTAGPAPVKPMTPTRKAQMERDKKAADLKRKRAQAVQAQADLYLQQWACFRFYCTLGEKTRFDNNDMGAKGFEAFAADIHQRPFLQPPATPLPPTASEEIIARDSTLRDVLEMEKTSSALPNSARFTGREGRITRDMLVRFYEQHEPSKNKHEVGKIMNFFSQEGLRTALFKRYGAVPMVSSPSPVTSTTKTLQPHSNHLAVTTDPSNFANVAAGAAASTIFKEGARMQCEDSTSGSRLSFTQWRMATGKLLLARAKSAAAATVAMRAANEAMTKGAAQPHCSIHIIAPFTSLLRYAYVCPLRLLMSVTLTYVRYPYLRFVGYPCSWFVHLRAQLPTGPWGAWGHAMSVEGAPLSN
jgi:Ca2+-binding EF-hand superfamily protein